MKTIIRFVFTLLLFLPLCLSAQQTGVVKGRVFDSKNNEPIPFANVVIWKTTTGTAADENGYFLDMLRSGASQVSTAWK